MTDRRPRGRAPEGGAADRVRAAFDASWAAAAPERPIAPLVVAVSGGLDSCALLHLCRFRAGGVRLVLAHFDHRMRAESDADGRWLRGLASAWGIDFVPGAAPHPLRSEAEAREARYRFLEDVRRSVGAERVATAHHADDQAETILFRLARGTGPAGLRGIRTERSGGVWRPLLEVWREDLEAYAHEVGLGWRDDPTNADPGFARNAVRHRILPEMERWVAPGTRRALVQFAAHAAHDEDGWDSLIPGLVASLAPVRSEGSVSVDRRGLAALHPAVRARVLRALCLECGVRPGARGTGLAVRFAAEAESGRVLEVGRGLTLRRDLDRITVEGPGRRAPTDAVGAPLLISGPHPGEGSFVLSGRRVRVAWGEPAVGLGEEQAERFATAALRFPLEVRGWRPGDRIRTHAGGRKLKQVFLEARIPRLERHGWPVVADAAGEVPWIPGLARSVLAVPDSRPHLTIGVR